jgi:hypothetical protein
VRRFFLAIMFLLIVLSSGCAKPDEVVTFQSPVAGVFYTVETYYNHTPVSDTTNVYAHLERDGKKTKMLVLEGGDLTVPKIIWNNSLDVTLCIDGGFTETFRTYVTLRDDRESSLTIRNHLMENCRVPQTP